MEFTIHLQTITKSCPCNIQRSFSKHKFFHWKNNDVYKIVAQNIDCEYPQSMFWFKKQEKNMYTPVNPIFYIEVGNEGVYISRTYFPDGYRHKSRRQMFYPCKCDAKSHCRIKLIKIKLKIDPSLDLTFSV